MMRLNANLKRKEDVLGKIAKRQKSTFDQVRARKKLLPLLMVPDDARNCAELESIASKELGRNVGLSEPKCM